jgi:L-seryl-tRNA(Ser) seleniumtransferase
MSDNSALRNIPQVEKLLADERFSPYETLLGRDILTSIIRESVDSFRVLLRDNASLSPDDLARTILTACARVRLERLQRVVNGTGVIIHTNFGRAPLSPDVLDGLVRDLSGYCNLEFFIPEKKRGRRGGFAERLLCGLTGCGDALIVNNNAAAVFLILTEFARGREVVISRSELVQIGGGFRVPDIMRQGGAELVEVGTTNITELDDYRRAITGNTSMILSVHQSNFVMQGFTSMPSLRELATLKSDSVLLVRDLGSGNLVADPSLPRPFEPTITQELAQGPDLVCFSGDKLLGSGQAGIIVGRKDLIARLRKNPLMRVLRVDKISYYILQETLLMYARGGNDALPAWEMIRAGKKEINRRIARFSRMISPPAREHIIPLDVMSTYGGGAMPAREIESRGIRIDAPGLSAEAVYDHFITGPVPVAGVILDGAFVLDFRTVFDRDLPVIAESFNRLVK